MSNTEKYQKIFYSPKGYWKGESAIHKLSEKQTHHNQRHVIS